MLINLKRLREDAGVSQRTLAENIGVSQQSINK
ncbi:MAG: helix-turn-helix domain-containing protein, partial [Oscillospiraceae bacterium]|nr:helix-turn-helix domain-containing protein [Oscillospiraceae bacterium]